VKPETAVKILHVLTTPFVDSGSACRYPSKGEIHVNVSQFRALSARIRYTTIENFFMVYYSSNDEQDIALRYEIERRE
jgi:hypothetical protein